MEFFFTLLGFLIGCVWTYFLLYIPSMKLCRKYQERLRNQLQNK